MLLELVDLKAFVAQPHGKRLVSRGHEDPGLRRHRGDVPGAGPGADQVLDRLAQCLHTAFGTLPLRCGLGSLCAEFVRTCFQRGGDGQEAFADEARIRLAGRQREIVSQVSVVAGDRCLPLREVPEVEIGCRVDGGDHPHHPFPRQQVVVVQEADQIKVTF
ncbi:hypothetical protein [Streptomyces sp. NBC_00576]|uniref:hypothetical protein n=1 Tax=Streptomyces sp. NBC_00576 TaxID=2903665 RepID=UPI002E805816|nr:hypothetical protein [Streptomyces sp. NBC_00576]WUB76924.1 hypothetical protein OG734_46645 [Streptomyces sp. NBC_00576]